MKKLIVKTVDSYTSKIFKGKTINEYIIYNALEDGTKISAKTVIGEEQKKIVIADEIVRNLIQGDELLIEEF